MLGETITEGSRSFFGCVFHKFEYVVGFGGWNISLSFRVSIFQDSYLVSSFFVQFLGVAGGSPAGSYLVAR
jgi:hypothetical protein